MQSLNSVDLKQEMDRQRAMEQAAIAQFQSFRLGTAAQILAGRVAAGLEEVTEDDCRQALIDAETFLVAAGLGKRVDKDPA